MCACYGTVDPLILRSPIEQWKYMVIYNAHDAGGLKTVTYKNVFLDRHIWSYKQGGLKIKVAT